MNIVLKDNQLIVNNPPPVHYSFEEPMGELAVVDVIKVGTYKLDHIKKVYILRSAGYLFVYNNKSYRVINVDDIILQEDKR
jgi:hypothetical protein